MPKTERDPLGPAFERRLRGALDRVQPRYSSPRYLATAGRPVALRLAPLVLAVSLVAMLGLSAYAATGSPNPVVWTQHVVTVIRPNTATPPPSASPQEERGAAAPTPSHQGTRQSEPQPSQRPEATGQPEPTEKPEPTQSPESGSHAGDHSGDASGGSGDRSGHGPGDGSGDASGSHDSSPKPGTD